MSTHIDESTTDSKVDILSDRAGSGSEILPGSEILSLSSSLDPSSLGDLTSHGLFSQSNQIRTFSFGIEAIIHKAWQTLKLTEVINKCIEAPKPRDGISWGELTEILVAACLASPGSRKSTAELYYPNSSLPFILGIPPEKVYPERLNKTLEHLEYYQEQILPEIHKQFIYLSGGEIDDPKVFYFDSTDFYLEGKYLRSLLADFGYSRSRVRGRKQVNFELLIDARYGFPSYIRCFPGSKMDMTRVKPLLYQLARLQYENVHLVFDRGYPSRYNRKMILSAGHTYTCGVKLGADTKDIIENKYPHGSNLRSKYLMNGKEYYIEEITDQLREWETWEENRKKEGTLVDEKERLFLVFNEENAENARRKLEERIEEAEMKVASLKLNQKRRLNSERKIQRSVGRILGKYGLKTIYEVDVFGSKGSYWVELTRLEDLIEDRLVTSGFSCILTMDETLTPGQVFKLYHSKDDVEKAFQILKGPIQARPIYSKKDSRVEGHIFVCILAYFLQQFIRMILDDAGVQISPQRFCKVMGRVSLVVQHNNNCTLTIPYLSDEQRRILTIFGILPPMSGD